jgi:hypothetical protein
MDGVEQLLIRPAAGGAVLAVKVTAGSSRDRIVGVLGECLKVATAAAPEKGKANASVAKTLAAALALGRREVILVAGASSPRKEFRIAGLSAEQLRKRLGQLLG